MRRITTRSAFQRHMARMRIGIDAEWAPIREAAEVPGTKANFDKGLTEEPRRLPFGNIGKER